MSVQPIRVQRKRTKGWRMPPYTQCVTRPGKFGNPFNTAEEFRAWLEICVNGGSFEGTVRDIPKFRQMVRIAERLEELRGLNLACFCPLDKECHADVLIEYANR